MIEEWLERWLREEASGRLERVRQSDDAKGASEIARRQSRLLTWEPTDADLTTEDPARSALLAHWHRAHAEVALGRARDQVEGCGNERITALSGAPTHLETWFGVASSNASSRVALMATLEDSIGPIAESILAARDAVELPQVPLPSHPDAGPAADDVVKKAREVLELTKEPLGEIAERLGVDGEAGREAPLWLAAIGERAAFRRMPWRAIAAAMTGFDADGALSKRARVEPDHASLSPRTLVMPLEPPIDVRLSATPLELGVARLWFAAEGVGRAFALCLANPGLPASLRWPVLGTVERASGILFALCHRSAAFLKRAYDADAAEDLATRMDLVATLDLRFRAARLIARAVNTPDEQADLLSEAIAFRGRPTTAEILFLAPCPAQAELRAFVGALSLAHGLREAFDDDWFRNPRAGRWVAEHFAQGGGSSIEELAAVLGAPGLPAVLGA